MNPILRTAKLSDLNKLKSFQKQLVMFERPFDTGIPKRGEVEYYNIKELIEDDNVNFLVVEMKNKVVGCGFGQIRKNVDWAINKNFGYIGLMFVEKKFRNQKMGKLIVDALLKWFKEKNIPDIRIEVYEKNVNAVNAYRKYGFEDFVLQMKYTP